MLFVLRLVSNPRYWLYNPSDKLQDGVAVVQLIAELVALLAALRAQRLSSPPSQLQQVSGLLHLLLLALLLVVMADVALNSAMRCVIPMAHMVVVARK
jgi:hypothetical protein